MLGGLRYRRVASFALMNAEDTEAAFGGGSNVEEARWCASLKLLDESDATVKFEK